MDAQAACIIFVSCANGTLERLGISSMVCILIVEDDCLLALALKALVQELDEADAVVSHSIAGAQRHLCENTIDVALLDVNLRSETSIGLALQLLHDGVPFAFISGANTLDGPAELQTVPFFSKPCRSADVLMFLRSSIRQPRRKVANVL